MTAQATVEETTSKAPLAWSALAVVVAGYLWALLDTKALTLLGLLAFLVATVILIFGLRAKGAAAKVVPFVVFAALVVASASVLILL